MSLAQTIVAELEREAASTARILERVPADKLDWAPHAKSMALGQLAWHIASLPKSAAAGLKSGERDIALARPDPRPDQPGDMVDAFRRNITELKETLSAMDDAMLVTERFSFKSNGEVVTSMPKIAMLRTVLLNHSYHHRGQLTVYLRLLDVPVPAMYGRSADENMFERPR
jgi:uncharacterized damage-inducible protein DinB